MAQFNLPFGVRISTGDPIDKDRYIAIDQSARESLITDDRAHVGLQVYQEDTEELYILKILGATPATSEWSVISTSGDISTTDDLTEGSNNLYFTDIRAIDAISGETLYKPTLESTIEVPNDVGGIPAGTTVGDLYGDSYTQMFNSLLFPTVDAYISTNNSLSMSSVGSREEIGTSMTPYVTAIYNPGVITNGDGSQGPNLTGDANQYVFKLPNGSTDATVTPTSPLNSQTYTFNNYDVTFGTNQWEVTASYDAGTGDYYDNKGNVITITSIESERVAGSINATSSITGSYYTFYGTGMIGSEPSNSSEVRTLINRWLNNSSYTTFNYVVASGQQQFYICLPPNFIIDSVINEGTFEQFKNDFTSTIVSVNLGGGTGSPESYTVYTQDIGVNGYTSDQTYEIKILKT